MSVLCAENVATRDDTLALESNEGSGFALADWGANRSLTDPCINAVEKERFVNEAGDPTIDDVKEFCVADNAVAISIKAR